VRQPTGLLNNSIIEQGKKTMKYALKGLMAFAVLMLIGSCDGLFLTDASVEFDYNKFNEEISLWDSSKPNDYQYNLEHWNNGFSIPVNTLIFVENGIYKNQITQENYDYESDFYLTIDDIYKSIEREYKNYHNTTQSKNDTYLTKIEIKYDAENHIPIEIKNIIMFQKILQMHQVLMKLR
jgi:hypothetical protein